MSLSYRTSGQEVLTAVKRGESGCSVFLKLLREVSTCSIFRHVIKMELHSLDRLLTVRAKTLEIAEPLLSRWRLSDVILERLTGA
jgi:hypothetical protein